MMTMKRENRRTWSKLHPSATLSTTNPTQTDMGLRLNPGQQSNRLATKLPKTGQGQFLLTSVIFRDLGLRSGAIAHCLHIRTTFMIQGNNWY